MEEHVGTAVSMDRSNVDTDQIIPKQFLKRIEKTGFGTYLFYDWRYTETGQLDPRFELNKINHQGCTILIANENFGCGSSREHAPWALLDYGFKVIIAPSFADIFYQNCLKNGIVPVQLTKEDVKYLLEKGGEEKYRLTVSIVNEKVTDDYGFIGSFSLHPYWKQMLINEWDEIEVTLQLEDEIAKFEER
ncbi:3-isopropylmalate dehydratase small subunit [Cytobacillus spongiae]|uniref:3-isopropylmalate dehydratase small subunit n=1 Tax=Cytobacillus spongiae TaxID=2901381 RepID=UPI001F2CA585|nr:3-isopropylmalate dehydratase small subunit [Cytobacillus spongiae]UII55079.1 3-isopropylmalate dehydratase small subunit [Cytobacillus spongiae]